MLRTILVGVAGTPALEAKIFHSIDLAKRHEALIRLLSIVDADELGSFGPVPIGASHYAGRMGEKRVDKSHAADEAAVAQCTKAAEASGIKIETLFVEGEPLTEIERHWRYADLLILGLRGWFDHGILPEPEAALAKLVKAGVRPIMAVPETSHAIKRVMIAYNGTMESAKAMKHFMQLDAWPDCALHIICVGDPRSGEEPHDMLEHARQYCARHEHEVTTKHVPGDQAVNSLLEHAEEAEADMIVMGGSYRRLLLADRFGRATVDLVRRSQLPLFISH